MVNNTIAIASTFTAEPIEPFLTFWADELRLPASIVFAPYGQIFQSLLDPRSVFGRNERGLNVLLLRLEDWRPVRSGDAGASSVDHRDVARAIGRGSDELIDGLRMAARRTAAPFLICLCPPSRTTIADSEFAGLLRELDGRIVAAFKEDSRISVVSSEQLLARYPVPAYDDPHGDELGHIPYAPSFYAALSTQIARRFYALKTPRRKVVVVDCDDTLWEGICGEVGPFGVVIDPPRQTLQNFLVAQQEAGMLLCLCSKNNADDVHAVFDAHPEMPLRRGHLVAERLDWQPKSSNIRSLAQDLDLGLDSFIFLDDNPVECAEVRAGCPSVLTLQVPKRGGDLEHFLAHLWAFDRWQSGTAEDRRRTDLYRENLQREDLRRQAPTLADFLASLDLAVGMTSLGPTSVSRVSQLTHRTNQFNVSTIRRSEIEIEQLCGAAASHECLTVEVSDRFGDYGLVGVLIFAERHGAIEVDTFLLSCRVLGRGVEHRMLAELGTIAAARGLSRVDVRAVPTARNRPAFDFLDAVGFAFKTSDDIESWYRFPVEVAKSVDGLALNAATVGSQRQGQNVDDAPAALATADVFERIAGELSRPDALVDAVSVRRLAMGLEREQDRSSSVPPASAVEQTVARVWCDLLARTSVGRDDNFFELGGDSLLAAQAVARLRQLYNLKLPLRSAFDSPTVAGFAQAVEARLAETAPSRGAIPKVARNGALPLSFAQQRIWFVEQLEPGVSYNPSTALRLTGPLVVSALERAVNEVVSRHEALRTNFVAINGRPMQVITPVRTQILERVDVAQASESQAFRLASTAAQRSFDLERDPLLRTVLYRIDDSDHLLLFSLHHIVSDGWSLKVLCEEVLRLYDAFSQGRPSPLPTLPLQFADYAAWQRDWLKGPALEDQVAYWVGQLDDLPKLLEIPADRPRPPVQSHRGGHRAFALSRELSARLKALSHEHGATVFMTLLAAFEILLSRHTNQDRFIVSSAVANRDQPETERMVGCLINVLLLRADLSGHPDFVELLRRTREVTLAAHAHQDAPFEHLVDRLHPPRDLRYHPLAQVMFVLLNQGLTGDTIGTLCARQVDVDNAATQYDIVVHMRESEDALAGFVHYSADLFDPPTIDRLLDRFERLLVAIVEAPTCDVMRLPLLTDSEREEIVVRRNQTESAFDTDCGIHDLVEAQTRRTPDASALEFEGRHLTYRELDERSNQLARFLRAHGVKPGALVALGVERSLEMVVGMLGILKAGAAYVPLDPAFPKSRLVFMLDDAGVAGLLTDKNLTGEFPPVPFTIALDADWDRVAAESSLPLPASGSPDDLAYVIYTSGSTGTPKGVEIPHRAVVNFLESMRVRPGLSARDRLVAVTTLSFDIAGLEIWLPLIVGATVVIASREVATDGGRLRDLLRASEATVMQATPSTWRLLIDAGWRGSSRFKALCGGEAFPPALASALIERSGSLWNMYGPTETTIWSAVHHVDSPGGQIPLGTPIANTTLYVLDNAGQPAPINVAGELFIGGVGLARGYHNRPELTVAKFLPDPFSATPGARLYRTGDLARHRPDGTLEYLGRLDHQVKIRGHRIELGEIDAALGSHPLIREAVVVAREEAGDKRLVAYCVPIDDATITTSELRRFLRDQLPEHMVPAIFVSLAEMPLTANGKVDRKALPAPDATRPDLNVTFVAPRNTDEELLAGIWSSLLGIEQLGVEDNFFDLGGQSIVATQVVARVTSTFGVELPLRVIFEQPTIAGLAQRVAALRAAGPGAKTPPLVPVSRRAPLPLSFAQQRLWFVDQLDPGNSSYNLPGAFWLDGPLRVDTLERSLAAIVSRHESLRTSFPTVDGRPVQQISHAGVVQLGVVDLMGLPEAEREPEARLRADAEAQRPFSLATGPLLRTSLIRVADNRHLFLVTMHHIISDGWSLGVFSDELQSLYEAFGRGAASPLQPLPIQYADFSMWQRSYLKDERLSEELAYWNRNLAGVPTLVTLPLDHPRPPVQTFRGRQLRFTLPRDLSEQVKTLSRRENVTVFMTLMAAFQVLLHRYTGQEQFIVSTGIANRTQPETEPLIGCLINVLLLKASLGENPTFGEVLQRVRQEALGAYAHQELPFEKIVEELQPDRDLSYNPLTQVMFVLLKAPMDHLELAGLAVEPLEVDSMASPYDIVLHMWETSEGFAGFWHFNTTIFDQTTIERMMSHLETLLRSMTATPGVHVLDAPLLTETERHRMLVEWNATEMPFPDGVCLHELFERQAARDPQAVAVLYGEKQVTYGELDTRANQLAHYLRRRGVGPDGLVGLCVERSIELVVGVLGILKAGGAYVPLDPAYPEDRLRLMLHDSQTPILLTQEHLRASLPRTTGEVVTLDGSWPEIAQEPTTRPVSGVSARHLSYVIYTSGSTGAPKGIALEHRGVVNNLVDLNGRHGVGPTDRVLALSSLSFDMCVYEILGTLESGGAIVMPTHHEWREPAAWAELAQRHRVTVWNSAPALLKMFVDYVEKRPELWPSAMHLAILGGDWVPVSLPDRLKAIAPRVRVIVLGGATEASIHSIIFPVETTDPSWKSIPYGKPQYNQKAYILNAALQPAPIGVPGELYLGGIGLGRGYFNRPEQTAERFLPSPFVPGERVYRTGDLACYRADGNIELIGRVDYQVKLRGLRIECGEIEATIRRHPAVREAVVIAKDHPGGDKRLVAYVRPNDLAARPLSRLLELQAGGDLDGLHTHELPNGLVVLCRNKAETDFGYAEIFGGDDDANLDVELDEGSCVFDVGANIGLFSLRIWQRCPTAHIFAFEPVAPVFQLLELNTGLYGLDRKLFNCGLASHAGVEEITYYPHLSLISGQFADTVADREVVKGYLLNQQHAEDDDTLAEVLADRLDYKRLSCEMKTLSQVIRDEHVLRIDLLKIDTERAELEVLAGIDDVDWSKIRNVTIEVYNRDNRLAVVTQLLERHGFHVVATPHELLADAPFVNVRGTRSVERGDRSARQSTPSGGLVPVAPWASRDRLIDDLRAFTKSKLPDYMVPSAFVLVHELPLSPNGKVDRKALTAFSAPDGRGDAVFVAPQGPIQEALARIFCDVLGRETVGASDNFFDIGGHSLLAAQVVARIRASFEVDLPLRAMFEAPSLAALATRVEVERGRAPDAAHDTIPPIRPAERTGGSPLSFAQQGLWFVHQLVGSSAAYNIAPGIRLRGPLDCEALDRAVTDLADRHEVLRTTFGERDGQVVQLIAPLSMRLAIDDLRALPVEERESAATRIADVEARSAFDLANGPLMRARLVRLADDDHLLTLTFHHIVVDGWSLDVVAHELEALYIAHTNGTSASGLPTLPIQFGDFAIWERLWLNGRVLEQLTQFWVDALAGAPLQLNLPTDRQRPPTQTLRGARHFFDLSPALASRADELGRSEGASLFMTMLAAFDVFLSIQGDTEDVLVGSPFANRVHGETHDLIGPFVNTLPLRAKVSRGSSFRALVRQVREATLAADAHQSLPFDRIVEAVRPPRDLSRNPIFQANFRMLSSSPFALRLPNIASALRISDAVTSKFDLALELCRVESGFRAFFEYSTDLFNESTIRRMAQQFERLVAALTGAPDRRLADLPMLTEMASGRRMASEVATLTSSFETSKREMKRRGVQVLN